MKFAWVDPDSGKSFEAQFDVVTKESIDSMLTLTKHPVEQGADVSDHAHKEPEKITIEGYVSNTPLPSNPGVCFTGDIVEESKLVPGKIPIDYSNVGDQATVFPTKVDLDYSNANTPDLALSLNTVVNAIGGAISSLLGGGPPTSFKGFSGINHGKPPQLVYAFKGVDGFANRARAMYDKLSSAQASRARLTVEIMLVTLDDMMITKISAPRSKDDGNGCSFTLELERVRIVSSETVDAPQPAEAAGAKQISAGTKHGAEDTAAKKLQKIGVGLALVNLATGKQSSASSLIGPSE